MLGHDDVGVDVEAVVDTGSVEGVFEEGFCGRGVCGVGSEVWVWNS